MRYIFNLLWAIIAICLCQMCISSATANKVIIAPEVGYRFDTNRHILVENDSVTISVASCTKFSLQHKTGSLINSVEETKTPLGVKSCSPYYKATDKNLTVGFWEFKGGISEYEVTSPTSTKITLIEPEVSKKFARYTFYLLFAGFWAWAAIFTNLYFRKRD